MNTYQLVANGKVVKLIVGYSEARQTLNEYKAQSKRVEYILIKVAK